MQIPHAMVSVGNVCWAKAFDGKIRSTNNVHKSFCVTEFKGMVCLRICTSLNYSLAAAN